MGTAGPRAAINAPAAGAPRVGLVASAVNPDLDKPWDNGITFEPEACVSGELRDLCDSSTVITYPTSPASVEFDPWLVIATQRCTTIGARGRDWEGQVRRRLESVRETLVSAEFWTGDLATAESLPNAFLAHSDSDILTESGPVGLTHGLACLQQYLAETNGGQRGMIHATRQVITHWSSLNLLRREGNIIFDLFDNIIVPGAGYDGSSPDGTVGDGNVWAYATGMVQLLLGDVETVSPIPDGQNSGGGTATNDVNNATAYAMQPALPYWDGCAHGAVRLDVTVCDVGGS